MRANTHSVTSFINSHTDHLQYDGEYAVVATIPLVDHHLLVLLLQNLLFRFLLCGLRHCLFLLCKKDFDVMWAAHVGVDTTVSPVRATSYVGGLVDLNVVNFQTITVQTL